VATEKGYRKDLALEKGLPSNLDAERFVLGSILLDDSLFPEVAGLLGPDDFALEKHRRIFRAMGELKQAAGPIDRVTLADLLHRKGQLESVDGLGYLVSLDDGLPQIANLDGYCRIVREKADLRRIVFAGQKLMDRALLAEESPEEILRDAQAGLLAMSDAGRRSGLASAEEILLGYPGGMQGFLNPSPERGGLATGFARFDEMTGGLHPGDLVVVAGRPGMGKTALALNVAAHAAGKGKPVAVFSLEMSKESLLARLLCAQARMDLHKFRCGFVNPDERRRLMVTANALCEAPLFVDESTMPTALDVHAKLRRLKLARGALGLAVVDYLQLMQSAKKLENRQQEVAHLSRSFKLMAKDLEVPILLLSQLSRGPETRPGDRRPILADLRESGAIEADADVVAFVFREEVYKPDREDLRGLAELIVAKQRNGPTGTVNLVFLRQFTRFENRTADLEDGRLPLE